MRTVMLLVLAGMAAGCRYRPEPVPVLGPHPEIEALQGRWEGGYSGLDSRRSGSITFDITAHGDSAFGDVLMRVDAEEMAPRPVDLATGHFRHARSADLLSIKFVVVTGGRLRGELEPYLAPDCHCVVRTVFEGDRNGDGIRGSFVTYLPAGAAQRGEWWAALQREEASATPRRAPPI